MRLSEMIEKATEIYNRVGDLEVETDGLPAAVALEEREPERLVVVLQPDV